MTEKIIDTSVLQMQNSLSRNETLVYSYMVQGIWQPSTTISLNSQLNQASTNIALRKLHIRGLIDRDGSMKPISWRKI